VPFGSAPNDAEAATEEEIKALLKRYREENCKDCSLEDCVKGLSAWIKKNEYNIYGKRYVYTKDGKWIDLLHFFELSKWGIMLGLAVRIITYW
jgi:hypothetical protein